MQAAALLYTDVLVARNCRVGDVPERPMQEDRPLLRDFVRGVKGITRVTRAQRSYLERSGANRGGLVEIL